MVETWQGMDRAEKLQALGVAVAVVGLLLTLWQLNR